MSIRNLKTGHEARISKQMRDREFDAIANVYPGADKRFQKWVQQNANKEDEMEQMNDILKRNQKPLDETNQSYTKSYIDNMNLFGQIGFHGRSRKRRSYKKRRSHAKRRSYKKRHCKRGGAGHHFRQEPRPVVPQPQPRDNNANAGNAFRTFRVYGEAFENPEQEGFGAPHFITVHMPLNSPVRDLFGVVNGHRMHRMDLPFELRVGNEPILINDPSIANIVGDVLLMVNVVPENALAHDPRFVPVVFRPAHPYQFQEN